MGVGIIIKNAIKNFADLIKIAQSTKYIKINQKIKNNFCQ